MSIIHDFVRRAESSPSSIFCHFYQRGRCTTLTVADVLNEARRFARHLRELSVQPGQIVPIILEHRLQLYTSFIGAILAGAVPTFFSPATRKQDHTLFLAGLNTLLDRLDPNCVIVSPTTAALFSQRSCALIDADMVSTSASSENFEALPAPSLHAIAFVQHSSGTTGHKKGVSLTHEAVLGQVASYSKSIGITDQDVIASWLPLYHDMGLITSFLMPMILGLPIVSVDALEWVSSPTILLDKIEKHRATLCWLPNFAFHHITRLAHPSRNWDLSSMRLFVNCSEPCRAAAFDIFLKRFGGCGIRENTLQTSYAMAENVFAVTQTHPADPVRRSRHPAWSGYLSSGMPIEGVEVKIGDAGEQDGEPAEIVVGGKFLLSEYLRLPEVTSQRLRNGWYHTGDLGFWEDGEIFVVGRTDDVLNINGKKLMAHEIEQALNDILGIAAGRNLVWSQFDDVSGSTKLFVAAERDFDAAKPDDTLQSEIRMTVFAISEVRPTNVMLLNRGTLVKSSSGKISRVSSIRKLMQNETSHLGNAQ